MLTRGLVVLALLFGVLSMHQLVSPEPAHAASTVEMSTVDPMPPEHQEHDGDLHLCVGLVVTALGLLALRLARGGVPTGTPAAPTPVVTWSRECPRRPPDLSRLCVLRL
ncbi:DUF6153 family protein [Umezawaea sp. NPDC059074]|uniref:DUF6153 family protein n=1 Tax=Umezawaea sp. NPDC059074 TaxID=3346716 RepID=UPI0036AC5DA2